MYIVHGTSADAARRAIKEGICPRGERSSLWEEHPSIPDHVYLTSAYGVHFARHAMGDEDTCALIEVDTQGLAPWKLYPDEDAVAQYLMLTEKSQWGSDLGEIVDFVRNNLDEFVAQGMGHAWSLRVIGNISYKGWVPPGAIKRVVLLHEASRFEYTVWHDPMISLQNYRFVGKMHENLQAMFLGRPFDREAIAAHSVAAQLDRKRWKEEFDHWLGFFSDRSEVIYDVS